MTRIEMTDSVGQVVARDPDLSRVFESLGIDYCCGGKKSLRDACAEKGLEPTHLLRQLSEAQAARSAGGGSNPAAMTLTELADHIEEIHHAYLRSELPRLDRMTKRVAAVHGDKEPRLQQLREVFLSLSRELSTHMLKEEQILFPLIRALEAGAAAAASHCGSLANPIRQMEGEHDIAAFALERQRSLTDAYQPPEWACNTYRAMLDALSRLDGDLREHIHKENNVLFPRALELESSRLAEA